MAVLPIIALRIRLLIRRLKRTALKLRGKKKRKSNDRIEPARRTIKEIKKDYGVEESPAAKARAALAQRKEKLKRVNDAAEDLNGNAENFAASAKELERMVASRKWWQI